MIERYYNGDLFRFDNQEHVDMFEKANDLYSIELIFKDKKEVIICKGKEKYDYLCKMLDKIKNYEGCI